MGENLESDESFLFQSRSTVPTECKLVENTGEIEALFNCCCVVTKRDAPATVVIKHKDLCPTRNDDVLCALNTEEATKYMEEWRCSSTHS
jgi:hypothetical protein